MLGVFTAPGQAFEDFCKRPVILIPLLTVLVLAGLGGALTIKQSSRIQVEMFKNSTTIPPAALEQMRVDAENAGPVSGMTGPVISVFIFGLVGALIAWILGSFVFGGQAKFSAVWAVGLMGGLISATGGLLKVPLVLAKDTIYVSIGLAALMLGKDFTSILYMLLTFLDFFVIWGIIVTGIGYATVFGLSRGKGMMVVIIPTVVMVGVMVGLMMIGMSFAGVEVGFL
jgi:hypothetical protein